MARNSSTTVMTNQLKYTHSGIHHATELSEDQQRGVFCDQNDRRVRVPGSDGGHRRSVSHSKTGDAVHATDGVEHRGGRPRQAACVKGSPLNPWCPVRRTLSVVSCPRHGAQNTDIPTLRRISGCAAAQRRRASAHEPTPRRGDHAGHRRSRGHGTHQRPSRAPLAILCPSQRCEATANR
jgi:hypothetical protein